MPCPDRLSQWSQQVSTAFAHLSKPQVWSLVLWSAGIALTGAAGIAQISASFRAGVETAGTNGVSTLTRVVSGCETQKREKAAGSGGGLLFCAFVTLDRSSLGARRSPDGACPRCHDVEGALDHFVDQRRFAQLRHPSGVEGAERA